MNKPMMKCGHAANATTTNSIGETIPTCAICVGITPNALIVDNNPPNLENRIAKCAYCKNMQPSNPNELPFFEYRPNQKYDLYYCGCRGWD